MSGFDWVCPTCGAATHSKEALVRASEKSCSCDSPLWVASDMPRCVGKLQEEIATLEASLAERWENLNAQDSVIDGLREEIASWQRVHRAEYEKREALDARLAALEKVQTSLAMLVRRLTYALRNNDGAATLRHQAHDYLTRNNLAGDPLREAGYLKEEG